ncbi:MAG TPA: hypothetical protein VL346_02365 [Acidobacteriaceae bacterium]|nr:hypothetical protein [Acidobacteriaceae bacterium]
MKALRIAAGIVLAACAWTSHAQSNASCGQALDASLRSGAILTIDSIPAGIELVATDQEKLHATCEAGEQDNADVHLTLSGPPTHSRLKITGSHSRHNHLQIRIELPRKVNLAIQMAAGQVTIHEVVGDKDINLHAGQITISSPHTSDYRKVDVSVGVGQVNAPAYGANKGGFFRSLQRENPEGDYRLHAHVAAGQIDLLGKQDHPGAEPN